MHVFDIHLGYVRPGADQGPATARHVTLVCDGQLAFRRLLLERKLLKLRPVKLLRGGRKPMLRP